MCAAEVIAVLEVEQLLARALGGHRELQPPLARLGRNGGAELLVDEHAGHGRDRPPRRPPAACPRRSRCLASAMIAVCSGSGSPVDAEELLLEGAAVVEGEDVELLVVAEFHGVSISKARVQESGGRGALAGAGALGRAGREQRGALEWVDDVLGSRSVRGVQAVRIGGQPVHHRVPLLRAPAAPARSQAAARGRRGRLAARPRRRWSLAGAGAAGARAPAPRSVLGRSCGRTRGPTRRSRSWPPAACCGWDGAAGFVELDKLVIVGPLNGDWWKLFTSQFAYGNGFYEFVALVAIAIFGWLLERRHGPAGRARAVPRRRASRARWWRARCIPTRS